MEVKAKPEVKEVILYIRKLAELGDFVSKPFEKVAPGKFQITLEFTKYEDFDWDRLEYYIEARSDTEVLQTTDRYILSFIEKKEIPPPVVEKGPELTAKEFKELFKKPIWKTWYFWIPATIIVGASVYYLTKSKESTPYSKPVLSNFKVYIDGGDASWHGNPNGTNLNLPLPGSCTLHFSIEVTNGEPEFQYNWYITTYEKINEPPYYQTVELNFSGSTSSRLISSPPVDYNLTSYFQYGPNSPLPVRIVVKDNRNNEVSYSTQIIFYVK